MYTNVIKVEAKKRHLFDQCAVVGLRSVCVCEIHPVQRNQNGKEYLSSRGKISQFACLH